MSDCLDVYSPEGHQTWMELERLLRDEGITPAMMKESRELLVNAMKSTLKNEVWAESVPESYTTAPEYNSDNYALSAPNRDTYRTETSLLPYFRKVFLGLHHLAAQTLQMHSSNDKATRQALWIRDRTLIMECD